MRKAIQTSWFWLAALILLCLTLKDPAAAPAAPKPSAEAVASPAPAPAAAQEVAVAAVSAPSAPVEPPRVDRGPLVTLTAEDTLVTQILNAFSRQTGRSIVIGPDITGRTTVRLNNVPWNEALDAVLKPFNYGHYEQGGATVVSRLDPVVSRVYTLKHLDASDVEEAIRSFLSPNGKLSKILVRSQSWGSAYQIGAASVAGGDTMGKRRRSQEEKELAKTKTIIVTDETKVLNQITAFLEEVDKAPDQILIEARFLEVNPRVLRDIGVEFGSQAGYVRGGNTYRVAGESVSGEVAPGNFSPVSTPSLNATLPFNAGLNLAFQKLTDTQYQMLLHMLQEDASANVLSAPRILTLNNQEAAIIVGTKYPIINSDASSGSGGSSATITTSLRGYEDIGIQLNVLPQICQEGFINMIVRPSVRELVGTKSGKTVSGDVTALTEYPVISTREAETQVIMRDGQTMVIGGLLKDRESKVTIKVPFLGSIPVLGWLFRRETLNTEKIDLLIFLTASIVPAEGSPLVLTNVNSLAAPPPVKVARKRTRALAPGAEQPVASAPVIAPVPVLAAPPAEAAPAAAPAPAQQPAVVANQGVWPEGSETDEADSEPAGDAVANPAQGVAPSEPAMAEPRAAPPAFALPEAPEPEPIPAPLRLKPSTPASGEAEDLPDSTFVPRRPGVVGGPLIA